MTRRYEVGVVASLTLLVSFLFIFSTAEAACDGAALGGASYGQSGSAVVTLQACLIEAGYSIPAGPTGYFGEQTRTAVRQFYSERLQMPDWDGMSVGPVGRNTLRALAENVSVTPGTTAAVKGYKSLTSEAELKKYLTAERSYGMSRSVGLDSITDSVSLNAPMAAGAESDGQSTAGRVSETNVQVAGIDEPDIVKTDGENIFVSLESRWYGWREPMPMIAIENDMVIPPQYQPEPTKVVDAYPVEDLAVVSEAIKETGEMLLLKDKEILVIFSQPNIVAYDVSKPAAPKKLWEREIDNNTSVVTSRLLNDTLYVVTQTYFDQARPCPVVPMRWGGSTLSIPCTGILVPEQIEPVSHLYTAMKIDPTDGSVDATTSVAGDYGGVTIMMSPDNLYIATKAESTRQAIMVDILIDSFASFVSSDTVSRAREIKGYNISESGKLNEIQMVFQSYFNSLSSDERLRLENEVQNVLQENLKKRVRDMYRTRIVRIGLDTLTVKATGDVPGYLLNQFAMDEYEGNLRVAVTVDDGWGGVESANDVYVLNSSLSTIGQIKNLGLSERIYSVRFMGDAGYLVTFRQTDPFYVLDLRTPTLPKVAGELKIPGYSAYLEYLGNDLVLGVGREGSGVKLSVFDVKNPYQPIEKAKYQLKDYWTEVESNHHAFLRDAKHEVFFIPGGEGGYIFSYAGGGLSLKKAVSGYGVKRALYLDDYMYLVSDSKITVLDENTWETVKELTL